MKIYGKDAYQPLVDKVLKHTNKWASKPKSPYFKNPKLLLKYNNKIESFMASKFHKGFVLILSCYDLQTGALIKELKKKKKPFLYVNWDEFIKNGAVVLGTHPNTAQLKYKQYTYNLKKVSSVYYDYFDLQEAFYFKRSEFNLGEQIFVRRWLEILDSLEKIIPKAKWLPKVSSLMRFESQNKFGEALFAQKLGLKVPPMIFTNEPKDIQKFAFDYQAILKDSGLRNYYGKGKILRFNAKKVKPFDKNITTTRLAPCLLQSFISKKHDVRVYVIEKQVIAIKIASTSKDSEFDWRRNESETIFTEIKLSSKVKSKLVKFAKEMGFKFASFDLVVDKKGDYYFLEMNRPGQWFFAEVLSGVPISKALAKSLK